MRLERCITGRYSHVLGLSGFLIDRYDTARLPFLVHIVDIDLYKFGVSYNPMYIAPFDTHYKGPPGDPDQTSSWQLANGECTHVVALRATTTIKCKPSICIVSVIK